MGRFSQRNNYRELPTQLKLEQVSNQFRTRVLLACSRLLESYQGRGPMGLYLLQDGRRLFEDFWIKELRQTQHWEANPHTVPQLLKTIINQGKFWEVFDLLEYLSDHTTSGTFKSEIATAFSDERLAYRLKGNEVIAVGTEEQAITIEKAFEVLETTNSSSAAVHLKKSSRLLAQGDYGGSVRESISAVESLSKKIEPKARTLGEALNKLNKSQPTAIHPALNEAFKKIYGYTSDTEGIRHSLIDETEAPVSENEALFMLGACSAFIPYLAAAL